MCRELNSGVYVATDFTPFVGQAAGVLQWIQSVENSLLSSFLPASQLKVASLIVGVIIVWLAFKSTAIQGLVKASLLVLGGLFLLNFASG